MQRERQARNKKEAEGPLFTGLGGICAPSPRDLVLSAFLFTVHYTHLWVYIPADRRLLPSGDRYGIYFTLLRIPYLCTLEPMRRDDLVLFRPYNELLAERIERINTRNYFHESEASEEILHRTPRMALLIKKRAYLES